MLVIGSALAPITTINGWTHQKPSQQQLKALFYTPSINGLFNIVMSEQQITAITLAATEMGGLGDDYFVNKTRHLLPIANKPLIPENQDFAVHDYAIIENSYIGDGCMVGDHTLITNSTLCRYRKISHNGKITCSP